jgi:hypothetical protein
MHVTDQHVTRLLPALPRPAQKALAQYVDGVVASGSILLADAAAAAPGPQQICTKARRFQRLLANERFTPIDAEPTYLQALLAGRRGRLPLYVDCTTTQVDQTGKGVMTLMLAIAVHDRAQPLLWHCWAPGTASGQIMPMVETLCARLAAVLPPGLTPVLMADRGFSAVALLRIAQRFGWHVLMRVKTGTRIRRANGTIQGLHEVATTPGAFVGLRAVQCFGPKTSGPAGAWPTWEEAPRLNAIAARPTETSDDPWLLITDLPPTRTRTADYRHRTRIEELFRDLKSYGWQWQRSRIDRPRRMLRQLSVLALATWWVTALGTTVIRQGHRAAMEASGPRRLSRFRLGRRWIAHCHAGHQQIRCALPQPPRSLEN